MEEISSVHILHVDDEPDFADLTAEFLEREDSQFTVETAPNVSTGLERLDNGDYDCIVSDYNMPGRDGIQFLKVVREHYPNLPFILFTGKGSESVAGKAVSAGVTDYLQKESGTEQYKLLANRIRNAVSRARAQRDRQRHLNAIETAQEGISILDGNGEFIYVNEAYADLYGYDTEGLLGEHWSLLYRDKDMCRMREKILPRVEMEGYWHGETTGLRADGSTFIEDHTLATTDSGELVCTVRNITQHKNREEQLRQERAFIEQALDALDDVFYVLGPEGELRRWNEQLATITGYTDDEIKTMRATAFFPRKPTATNR